MITIDEVIKRSSGEPAAEAPATPPAEAPVSDTPPADTAPAVDPPKEENKADEPVKTEEPAKEENKAPSLLELLKEKTGGKIEKEEDLQTLIEIREKYNPLNEELAQERSKREQLEEQYKGRFANPLVETLNGLYQNGATEEQINTFLQLQKVDFKSIDGLEAKALRLQYEKNFTRQEAMEEIYDEYNLDPDAHSEEEIEKAKRRIERNKLADVQYLEGLKKEVTAPAGAPDPEQVKLKEAQKQVRENQISTFATEVANKMDGPGTLEVVSASQDVEAISLEVKYPEEFKKAIPGYVKDFMLQQGLTPGAESDKAVAEYVNAIFWAQNGQQIAKTAAQHARSVVLEREVARNSNRSNRQTDTPRPTQSDKTLSETLREGLGGGGRRFIN